jgi:hypothetical protein
MTATATTRAGTIQIQQRDIDGLVLCGEHGGAPYDLLGAALGAAPARLRGITARWRHAGYAQTGQLGPGPAWCWLTAAGIAATGLGYRPGPPHLARVEHGRAVLAVRLALQSGPDWQQARPWWQSERRIRRKGTAGGAHRPDAEIWWPAAGGKGGQVWAVEIELTPKHAPRTAAIMTALAAAGYARILYFAAPAALPVLARSAAALPAAPVTIHNLPRPPLSPAHRRRPACRNALAPHCGRQIMQAGEKVTGNKDTDHEQGKQAVNTDGIIDSGRVISYNLSEGERPGGMKVRYKIQIVSGPRAKAVDARQAQVIREVLEWSLKHRQPR